MVTEAVWGVLVYLAFNNIGSTVSKLVWALAFITFLHYLNIDTLALNSGVHMDV